jgi:Uncharacterized conserved protein
MSDHGKRIEMSVREILTEMKDISEVIVDLAYASIMYNSQDMADSVMEFEDEMDELKYAIREKVMLAARTKEDARQLSGILQVASAADRISHAAGEIVKLLDVPLEKRPFLPTIINESEEKIKMTKINASSDMAGNTIDALAVEAVTGMKIIALKNRQGWIYDPEEDVKLRAGDDIVVRGTEDGFRRLTEFASGAKKWEFIEAAEEEEEK